MKHPEAAGFSTRAVHAGQEPDPVTGAVMTPIYQTSTYVQEQVGVHKGYEYARTHNRTREALEANIAALEGSAHGICFASGTAAVAAVLHLLRSGDEVVSSENLYGGTYRLFEQVLRAYELRFVYVDATSTDAIAEALSDRTRMVYLETPTNPLLRLTDLRAASELVRSRRPRSRGSATGARDADVFGGRIPIVVDNTFMTPYFQRPLELGADVVVHSTTKFLNGHSDMVGGIVVTNDAAIAERLRFLQNAVGAVPGPFDCWLALRGTKTLALRMAAHERSAMDIAHWLEETYASAADGGPVSQTEAAERMDEGSREERDVDDEGDLLSSADTRSRGGSSSVSAQRVATAPIDRRRDSAAKGLSPIVRVHYPGLESHPQHELARRQMSGFGGIISLEMSDGDVARRFLASLRIFALAESLASHPAAMTHATVPPERREAMGLVDNLVRLSVGIENVEDLRADIEQALRAAAA